MVEALQQVNWSTSCRTNHEACLTHSKPEKKTKLRRTCPKFVPRNLHPLHQNVHIHHRVVSHQHGYENKFIVNNDNCLVCQSSQIWCFSAEAIPGDSITVEHIRAAVVTGYGGGAPFTTTRHHQICKCLHEWHAHMWKQTGFYNHTKRGVHKKPFIL